MGQKHCEFAKITSEISDDGKTVFIRFVFDQTLCCAECFKMHMQKFMHQLDFKYLDKDSETALH